eukprot:13270709-Ditylum_brightwellii.AAC.2
MQIDNTMEMTQQDNAEYGKETYKERLCLAGEQDIGEVLHKETTTRIEFNMGLALTKFMAKSSLLQVMTRITHVDDSVYVKSMHT